MIQKNKTAINFIIFIMIFENRVGPPYFLKGLPTWKNNQLKNNTIIYLLLSVLLPNSLSLHVCLSAAALWFTPAEQPLGFFTICPPAASIRVTILWAILLQGQSCLSLSLCPSNQQMVNDSWTGLVAMRTCFGECSISEDVPRCVLCMYV